MQHKAAFWRDIGGAKLDAEGHLIGGIARLSYPSPRDYGNLPRTILTIEVFGLLGDFRYGFGAEVFAYLYKTGFNETKERTSGLLVSSP